MEAKWPRLTSLKSNVSAVIIVSAPVRNVIKSGATQISLIFLTGSCSL